MTNTATPTLIDGKSIARHITDRLTTATQDFTKAADTKPCLAVLLVGDNPASAVYVKNKGRTADKIGFKSIQKTLPAHTPEKDVIKIIEGLNNDPEIHGILVQLPLPEHINEHKIIELINPAKDVDGFHPVNVGRLSIGQTNQALTPCTPAGSILLAKSALGNDLSGKHVVIIGRSNIVGKPATQLFLIENCTSRTKDIKNIARQADILVAAVGRPEMIDKDWVKPGATVIDVGINRVDAPERGEGKTKLVGDVDFDTVQTIAGAITPVPGGVGPMTIAMLMVNTFTAACRHHNVDITLDLT